MLSKVKRFLRLLSVGLIAALPLVATQTAYAASATLSLSPASSSVSQGATLSVSIRVNSGSEPVNGVQANLTYPANLLDFVSISSSSAFSIVAQNSGGGGSVQVGRGALPAVSGSQTVATVKFKAKTNAGSAAISFAGGSQVISASSNANIMTGSSGGNYTLKAPTVAPPAAPEGPKDTIPPTVTTVKSADAKTNSVTITWTTSEPSTSEVLYGLNSGYGLSAVDSALVTEHKVVLSSALLTPGTTYHYMTKSVDASGNAASSKDNTFTTKGAVLLAKVVDKSNKPLSGAKVTFGNNSAATDKNGQAKVTGLTLGKQTGLVNYKGKQTAVSADIKTADETKPETATFKVDTPGTPVWIIVLPLLALAGLVLYLMKQGKNGGGGLGKFFSNSSGSSPKPPAAGSNAPSRSQAEPSVIRPNITSGPTP